MSNCPKCGLPVSDGAKFCNSCGAKLIIAQRNCSMCGNTLADGAKFCNICGTPCPVQNDAELVDDRNPTMDEIAVPIIDESALIHEKPKGKEEMPTMDSVYMPGQEPNNNISNTNTVNPQQSTQRPTAEEIAMANRTVTVPETPVINETPYISGISVGARKNSTAPGVLPMDGTNSIPQESYQQPYAAQNNTIPTSGNNMPQQNRSNFNNYTSQASSSYISPEGTRTPVNYAQGISDIPNITNSQTFNNTVHTGSGKSRTAINIILILLIIAVILVDVFWLFRDKIFDNNNGKTNSNAASVTIIDTEKET